MNIGVIRHLGAEIEPIRRSSHLAAAAESMLPSADVRALTLLGTIIDPLARGAATSWLRKHLIARLQRQYRLIKRLAEPVATFVIIKVYKEIIQMATTTVPGTQPKTAAPVLTPAAIAKVKEIMAQQTPVPSGLRLSVVGGGCSGFQYSMAFENGAGMMDKVFDFDGLKVYVDATSLMYLGGANVDYVETLEGAGFKFENPNVKSTCGCGSSFNV
jgi:iron-sulfur cluster assembly accessory protein